MTPDEQRQQYANGVMAGVHDAHHNLGGPGLSSAPELWARGYRDGRRWYLRRVASLMLPGEPSEEVGQP